VIKGQPHFGIDLEHGSFCSVQGNHVSKASQEGVLAGTVNSTQFADNALKSCHIGLWFVDNCAGGTISGNTISGSEDDGLRVDGTGAAITGNSVHGSHANGVHLGLRSTGNTLSQNVAHGNHDFDLLDESGGANTIESDNDFGTTSP